MGNTRIGKLEAIAFFITIMSNHVILIISKSIISSTNSSALINAIYVSSIALILSYIIYILLNKFPTFDILDISNFLGGKTFKYIIGFLFLTYFIFFSATLLKNFVYCLQIIYYPNTNTFSILLLFFVCAFFVCNLKYNALYRSNLLTIPLVILSILILFLGNLEDFSFENIFPILGNGINETFLYGISNLFTFQGLLYLLFLPPHLKDCTELKKISIISILFSAIYLITSIATILFLFNTEVTSTLLMPLYSAVRYIEFGTFFQRLDSVFILIWIISFISYLTLSINICSNIFKKTAKIQSTKASIILVCFLMLIVTFLSYSYGISTFLLNIVYKYSFFIILGISLIVLLSSYIFKISKTKKSYITNRRKKNFRGRLL